LVADPLNVWVCIRRRRATLVASRRGDLVALDTKLERSSIAAFFERVRALLYRHHGRRAALTAAALILVLTLLLPLAGDAFGGSRSTTVALLSGGSLLALLATIAAVVLGVVAPRRRFEEDAAVARWVGERVRPLASDLLSTVELSRDAATADLAPTMAADGAPRRPRPGAPSAELVGALAARTAARVATLDPAALIPRDELLRAWRWALLAAGANVVLLIAAPRLVRDGWHALLVAPTRPFGGAELSPVPLVGDLEARLDAPAYSRRPPLVLPSSSGDLRGLPGTVIHLKARLLAPAAAVELVLEPTDHATGAFALPVRLDGDQLAVELVVDHPARYRFALTSADGRRSIETTPRTLEPEPDQAPTVQLLAPADVLDVTSLRRVELAYVIEDDFAVAGAELVWEGAKEHGRLPVALTGTGGTGGTGAAASGSSGLGGLSRAQGKLVWDIAEVQPTGGGEVRYWLEAKDNDTVGGPNVGRSRELKLRIVSPRERHEETLVRQQEVAEKLLRALGGRLALAAPPAPPAPGAPAAAEDPAARDEIARVTHEVVVELGSLSSAFEKDPHASDALRKALAQMRERLDKLTVAEARLMPRAKPAPTPTNPGGNAGRFAATDAKLIAELEDDAIVLADWLDRERLEGVLDLSDEIAAHQARLKQLLEDYAKSHDPRLKEEIDRELRALDKAFAELAAHRGGLAEDVVDQFVNQHSAEHADGASCASEVGALVRAGKLAEAQAKLASCAQSHARDAAGLDAALAALRGDRFGDEQKKLDEVMNELSDVAKDQEDIAAEASRIFDAYAGKADEIAKDNRQGASRQVGALVEQLRRRLGEVPDAGLTPFAREELDVVERRLTDVEHMVADGDLAEALAMAKQAQRSLDTIAGELDTALTDDPKSKWAADTQEALDGLERARPIAKQLIDALSALSPRPDQLLSDDDQTALERLRRRQAMNRQRAAKLGERTKQLGGELPGDAAGELGKKLGGADEQMGVADERMKAHDPSGSREATREAADALAKARDRARAAARQAQEGAVGDEPIRIPGADEYRAPERFREDVLEAMKKKGAQGPDGYAEMIKRYYEELVR
jgi:hypothetical protein